MPVDRAYQIHQIDAFMQTVLSYHGKPYRWGGDDPSGFDCSGLVVEGLKASGLLGGDEDLTADALWQRYRRFQVSIPSRGSLAFVLNAQGRAGHVVVCLNRDFYVGADGGGQQVVTEQDAWERNAFVKIRPLSRFANVRFVNLFERQE